MADSEQARLGDVQETLFIPLAARARQAERKRLVLRDPKAAEILAAVEWDAGKYGPGAGGSITVLRTAIFDLWVREFLASHPAGTVVELGTGLNARFERVDNGTVHWIDLDLPDTIDMRRRFFADTERRQMTAASVLDGEWLQVVAENPGPYFFVTEGVLVYLPEAEVTRALAQKRDMPAKWAWACDDPRSLERLGLRAVASATITRPPAALRHELPASYRLLLPLAHPLFGKAFQITLFQACP